MQVKDTPIEQVACSYCEEVYEFGLRRYKTTDCSGSRTVEGLFCSSECAYYSENIMDDPFHNGEWEYFDDPMG